MKTLLRLTLTTVMIGGSSALSASFAQTEQVGSTTSVSQPSDPRDGSVAVGLATESVALQDPKAEPATKTAVEESTTAAAVTPKAEEKKIETVAVENKALKSFESFSGSLESTRTQEVKLDFESWTDLVVEQVVEQGAAVAPGKTILKLKTETLDKALAEAEFALKNAQFDHQKADLELKLANETFEMDKAQTERDWQQAQDDYQYYLNVELPNQMDDLTYNKKSSTYSLEYSKDELDQLQKMYLEDELTEESEAIVLKRAQRSVESAERFFKRSTTNIERQETTEIPRQKIARELTLRRAEQEYKRAMIALPIAKEKAEIAFQQAALALEDKTKKFKELTADREKMEIKAVSAGIVYYGKCEQGKWSGRKLEVDQKLIQDSVVMTIVDTGSMMIRANLEESKLANLSPKMRGKAMVSAANSQPLAVTINSLANISGEDGKFDCEVVIDNLPGGINAMPGMTCKLSFLIADRDALMTKKASVFSDDDGVSNFVYLVDGDQTKRTEVVVGKAVGDEIEIVDGLAAGAKIAKARQ